MTDELRPTPGGEGYENPEAAPVYPTPGPTEADTEAAAKSAAPAAESAEDLESKTNAELQSMLAAQGLPTSGTKAELIERLTEG